MLVCVLLNPPEHFSAVGHAYLLVNQNSCVIYVGIWSDLFAIKSTYESKHREKARDFCLVQKQYKIDVSKLHLKPMERAPNCQYSDICNIPLNTIEYGSTMMKYKGNANA